MLSLSKLQDQIYESLNVTSDDTDIDPRLITDLINQQRALWIRNEYNKNRQIHESLVQDLSCADLELADSAACCDIKTGCNILRTVLEIPSPIEFHNSDGIRRVGPVDRLSKPYSYITYSQIPFAGNGRHNKNSIFAFLLNKRIHLFSTDDDYKFLSKVNIRGVFENPTEAGRFTDCDSKPCYTSSTVYPLTEWMWEYIKPQVLQQLAVKLQLPTDEINDAADIVKANETRQG